MIALLLAALSAWAVWLVLGRPALRRVPGTDQIGPTGVVAPPGGRPVVRRRSATDRPRADGGPAPDLADTAELLAVAVAAGAAPAVAVPAVVGVAGPGPAATALALVAHRVDRGDDLDAALGPLDALGPGGRAVASVLRRSRTDGTPAAAALREVARAERRRDRRRREARVRRLPVLLCIPLVGFVLPAFVVLTLVPVGLAASRAAFPAASPAPVPFRSPP